MKVTIDLEVCNGFGHCIIEAPTYFDLDDDNKAVVLRHDVDPADEAEVKMAALLCPVRAIQTID